MHKARIVSLLRRNGHCVGYMGDGVNIMKYLKLALSSNFGNIISVLAAGAFLPFVPMSPRADGAAEHPL